MFIMPVGLTWDPDTDTFYYQEKNCDTFVQMDPDGNTLRVFPNPSPPTSFTVYDGGLALHLGRRTLFFTSADPGDLSVTKALEMTLDGALTGLEVPILSGPSVSDAVHGLVFAGGDLVGVGPLVEGPALLRLMVFSEESSAADFRRGDSNGDGKLNITDPIQVLAHLFQGGTRPACFDAADADDNGALEITDAVRVLGFLFLGGGTIPAPGPDACGPDPNPDKEGADFGCAYLPGACPQPE
jgi:hypothetical protein